MSFGFGFGSGRRRARSGGAVSPVLVSPPAGFSFTGPYRPNVFRSGSGPASVFSTDYDLAARKALIVPQQTIFVRKGGSNNNNGLSPGQAIRSLDLAVRMANAFGTATRIDYEAALPGAARVTYLRLATQARTGGVLVNGINLDATYTDCWQTHVPVVDILWEPSVAGGSADNLLDAGALTFSATADPNIYSHPAGGNRVVFDYANLDEKGCPIRLAPLLTTPANTNAPWPKLNALYAQLSPPNLLRRGGGTYATGVCYFNGTTFFIRAANNRNLVGDGDIVDAPLNQVSPILRANTASGANRRFVVDGLGFMGGNVGCLQIRGDNGFRVRVDLARCRMFGNTDGRGAVAIQPTAPSGGGGADVIAFDCAANGGARDGWSLGEGDSSLIDINCIGDWNGWDAAGSNNGHTAHGSATSISVMGSFRNNQDRSVHHVHGGTSWMLGCESGTRRGADATDISMAYSTNNPGQSPTTRDLWLDAPRVFNGPFGPPQYNFGAGIAGSTLFVANSAATINANPPGWAGDILTYTP